MHALRRYRIKVSRSWWPWVLVAVTLGCLGASQVTSGWVAGAASVSCLLSLVALWLVVTIRRDAVVDDIVEDAGGEDSGSARCDADGLESLEAEGDHYEETNSVGPAHIVRITEELDDLLGALP